MEGRPSECPDPSYPAPDKASELAGLGAGAPMTAFDVEPVRIEGLGAGYSPFVNSLLDLERAAAKLDGYQLTITQNENTADGGVDAGLRGASRTDWLPEGDSAWQFKRSAKNWGKARCAQELSAATWAQDCLRNGGSYVLVLGSRLTDRQIEERRRALGTKAVELGLIAVDDRERVRVYGADALARWASTFLPLAVSSVLGGPGPVAIDFEYWSHTPPHQLQWVTDETRTNHLRTIREDLNRAGTVYLRVHGASGIGKTRLVMEALRDPDLAPLVAYVGEEATFHSGVAVYLSSHRRPMILVVDECAPERHVKVLEKLQHGNNKVVTIGAVGAVGAGARMVTLTELTAVEDFLRANYPQLSAEARRFVADYCHGNVRWADIMANGILQSGGTVAADIIQRRDIEEFVTSLLPEGRDFLLAGLLALIERVGWERDVRPQLALLASFAGVPVEELAAVGQRLEIAGYLSKQGRYRAVTPLPLAVFLAAAYWNTEGDRILRELLPQLDEGMILGLFKRAAELGRFEPARAVLPSLLGPGGPFASLETIQAERRGPQLTQLAIVLPDEVAEHVADLVEASSEDELLKLRGIRRDLVWTLEKLVWHSRTFTVSADTLLRLALAENETYGNNATGTWLDLFGTFLPGTAAKPSVRSSYLDGLALNGDKRVRELVVKASAKALVRSDFESIVVSGELQGGVLVEPRGKPETWPEAASYWQAAVARLLALAGDGDATVMEAAEDALVGAMQARLGDPLVGGTLLSALQSLQGRGERKVRQTVEHLQALYRRHPVEGREALQEALDSLAAALPQQAPRDEVNYLLTLNRWDIGEDELKNRMIQAVARLGPKEHTELLNGLVSRERLAAWEVGYAVGLGDTSPKRTVLQLVKAAETNFPALIGYLFGRVDAGEADAFLELLNGTAGRSLSVLHRLAVAVRAPDASKMHDIIGEYCKQLSVADGANITFSWQVHVPPDEASALLVNWLSRISNEADYGAVVQWFGQWQRKSGTPAYLREQLWELVLKRKEFPAVFQHDWTWDQLARAFLPERAAEVARMIFDVVESGEVMIHPTTEEGALLREAVKATPEAAFVELMDRINKKNWRVEVQVRGWLLDAIPVAVIKEWIGESIHRGRLVASVVSVGDPGDLVRLLLGKWPEDEDIGASLAGQFISGSWTGSFTSHLAGQIAQLKAWVENPEEDRGVKHWARRMIKDLDRQRREALEREAEGRF